MSFNICALSGSIVEEPVFSTKSGHIFEKRLIEKHINATGTCPVTGEQLSIQDLIQIKAEKLKEPRSSLTSSIPGLFTDLQSDFDELLTETYNLKKELELSKQELSHSLYQNDAACRVISNLILERDSARDQLENYKLQLNMMEDEEFVGDETENMGIYSDLQERIAEFAYLSANSRKEANKLSKEQENAAGNDLYKYKSRKIVEFSELAKDNTGSKNITTSQIHPILENFITFGLEDGATFLGELNLENYEIKKLHHLHVQKKSITALEFYPSANILAYASASEDSTCSFYIRENISDNSKFSERYKIKNFTEAVTGLSFHPMQEYGLVCSSDGHWSFHNFLKVKISVFLIF